MIKKATQQPTTSTTFLQSTSDDEDEQNEVEMFRSTERANLDVDLRDRNLTPEQIATLFIEIAQRSEKCFDFEISAWLEKYDQLRQHPNFAEAALLISSASQIYARKVDYFEDMVMQMGGVKEAKMGKKGESDPEDQTKVVRRRGKKFRPNTIADSFNEVEFIVKEFTQLPSAKLTEIVQKKKTDFNSHWEKFKASQCRFIKNRKNKLVVSKKMTENSELIATNATFGKTQIYDYDGEEVVGTKSDFRCFSNIVNENCELITDYNFTKYFEHVDLVDQEEEKRQRMIALGLPTKSRRELVGPKRFHFYISKEYLKETYGIDVETTESKFKPSAMANASTEKSLLLENIGDFSDLLKPNMNHNTDELNIPLDNSQEVLNTSDGIAKSIVSVDSAYQSISGDISSQNLDGIPEETAEELSIYETSKETNQDNTDLASDAINETFFDAVEMDIDHELTAINLNKSIDENREASSRLSDDEGIFIRSPSIQSPNHLSDAVSVGNMNDTQRDISDFMYEQIQDSLQVLRNGLSESQMLLPTIAEEDEELDHINAENMFEINPVYLNHKEDFVLPFYYLLKPVLLSKNILQLPESKVRKRCLFSLPSDEFTLKTAYMKLPPEPKAIRALKSQLFKIGDVMNQSTDDKISVADDDEEDFLGFSEDELFSQFMNGAKPVAQSTPLKPTSNNQESNVAVGADDVFTETGKRKSNELLNQEDAKRISMDADIEPLLTDDEDLPESQGGPQEVQKTQNDSDENLSTPERIKRDAQARVSRDSGINATSPEPPESEHDEVLTVLIDQNNSKSSEVKNRRLSNDSASVDSFDTAENGPTLVNDSTKELSLHDQRLVEQAQQKYQQQVSDMQTLVEKVNRWHQHLKPILKDSQERNHFDIHECGTEILDIFHEEAGQDEITFSDVMSTKPQDYIARYFLSTLMLVNTGNVDMVNTNTDVNQVTQPHEIQLKLKSRVRLHEEIENMNESVPCIKSSKGIKRKTTESGSSLKSPKTKKKKGMNII